MAATTQRRDSASVLPPVHIRLAYAAPAFALAMVGVPVFVYLPRFYTDVVGVGMTTVGAIFLAARAFDAITDPLMGFVSDRYRSPQGRRRPFIAWSVAPLAGATLWLYAPPDSAFGQSPLWFGIGIFALFLFWTSVIVPYKSLGPELTTDYDARTNVFVFRETAVVLGTLAAVAVPVAITRAMDLDTSPAAERVRFALYAWVAAAALLLTCTACILAIREPLHPPPPGDDALFRGIRSALSNRPFALLLVAYTVIALGSNLPATLITYFVRYVLHADNVGFYLVLYFTIGISTLPLWLRLSARRGKKFAWLASMVINTGAFAPVFFLERGDDWIYATCVGLSGTAGVAAIALPSAMQADVIEYDELRTGRRREGQFMGLWSIAEKLAAAIGIGVSMPILEAAGYVPNTEQTPLVLWTLKSLYVLLPVGCNIIAFVIAWKYPIDRKFHHDIVQSLADRTAGRPFVDPLARPRPPRQPQPPLPPK